MIRIICVAQAQLHFLPTYTSYHGNGRKKYAVSFIPKLTVVYLTVGVGGFGPGERDVGALPENVAVFPGLSALATADGDPVLLVRCALASPRRWVELVVTRTFAAPARVYGDKNVIKGLVKYAKDSAHCFPTGVALRLRE